MLGAIIGIAPFAVQLVETIFRKIKPGAKTSSDKLDLATQILRLVTAKLDASSGPQPTDDAIKAVIETSLAQLQGTGILEQAADAADRPLVPVPLSKPDDTIYVFIGGRLAQVVKPVM